MYLAACLPRLATEWIKERGIIYIHVHALSCRTIYLVTHLARHWITTKQTSQRSRLVWWIIKSGPIFCSFAFLSLCIFQCSVTLLTLTSIQPFDHFELWWVIRPTILLSQQMVKVAWGASRVIGGGLSWLPKAQIRGLTAAAMMYAYLSKLEFQTLVTSSSCCWILLCLQNWHSWSTI